MSGLAIAILCISTVFALYPTQSTFRISPDVPVPVQLAVMSQCPDGIFCETHFTDVLEQVSDKVVLTLIYIARSDPSAPVFGLTCKHGELECAGNVQQLCVARYTPFATWWKFVQCQNTYDRHQIGLPEIALQCASSIGVDWQGSKVGQCAGIDGSGHGEEGIQLLKESAETVTQMGLEKSCTVVINGKPVCVRDDYTWKDCENGHSVDDFVNQILEEYENLNGGSLPGI